MAARDKGAARHNSPAKARASLIKCSPGTTLLIIPNAASSSAPNCRPVIRISNAFWRGTSLGSMNVADIGRDTDADLRQHELSMLGRDDEVGSQEHFETGPNGQAVDRADDGLEQIRHLREAAESTLTEVLEILLAIGHRVQIPPSGEELLTGAGENRDSEVRVVAKIRENSSHLSTGWSIERVGLGPVQNDLEYLAVSCDLRKSRITAPPVVLEPVVATHGCLTRISASAATTPSPSASTIRGLISSSTMDDGIILDPSGNRQDGVNSCVEIGSEAFP